MELKGKKVSFLGDSITEGVEVSDLENRYDNRVKRAFGLKAAYNYGVSGTRIAHQSVASPNARRDLFFCGRAYDINPESDVIVVFGGTNDYGHGDAPFGELTDRTPNTFCGGVDFLMNLLKTHFPNAKSVFLTPARREGDELPSTDIEKKADAKPLRAYVDVIIKKGEEYGIPVLDLYAKLSINANIETQKQKFVPDGVHFNDAGHEKIAELVIEFLKEI